MNCGTSQLYPPQIIVHMINELWYQSIIPPSGIHPLGIITTACLADMTQKIEESCSINKCLPPPVNVCGKISWQVKV